MPSTSGSRAKSGTLRSPSKGDIRVGVELVGLSPAELAITAVLSGINRTKRREAAPASRPAEADRSGSLARGQRPYRGFEGNEYFSKNCHIVSSALTRMMPRPTPARIQFFIGPMFRGLPGQT